MAEMDNSPSNTADDERPIAVRRKRWSSSGPSLRSRSNSQTSIRRPHGISTPPETPKRSKKRVRFSDPGPSIESESISSGLTPFIRRTVLYSPSSNRRHSTPAKSRNFTPNDAPIAGTLQFEPLRQILDDRVKRRLRRHKLSEEVNNIDLDKRCEAKARKTEVERLREELTAKDIEMQNMKEKLDLIGQTDEGSGMPITTNTAFKTKVRELEQQIVDLKAEVERRESDVTQDPDWTFAARDPFNFEEDDDDMMITNYDMDNYDHLELTSMVDDEIMTTPTRLRTSFPSPPSTMPNTPCKAPSVASAGIQASLPIPDPEKDQLKAKLDSLESEISKLTSSIAFKEDNTTRLTSKLSDFIPTNETNDYTSLDTALDEVLTQLALSQSHALEKEAAFSVLSNEITTLGFSSCSGPEETLSAIAAQFRQARLALEYLTPGEVVEGFENEKLLDMLVSRVRVLAKKVMESDESIDQYHDQELLLRQQLGTRVDAHRAAERELSLANDIVEGLKGDIEEKELSNSRLQRALEGYRDEVSGLEKLIETMEKDAREHDEVLKGEIKEIGERLQDEILKHDTTRASEEGTQILVMELERRLNAAMQALAEVQEQIAALATSAAQKEETIAQLKSSSVEREREHGAALAFRDAQVSGLRGDLERVSDALEVAQTTICNLRQTKKGLESQIEGEKTRGQFVVQAMREQMKRVMETGMGYINGSASVQSEITTPNDFSTTFGLPESHHPAGHRSRRESSAPAELGSSETVIRRGRFLDGNLARRGSKGGKKRRRYDSGLGFLEEEEDNDETMTVEM
jgi:hypothetical protein